MLMRGAVAAQFEGVFEPYFRAAYHHMWEEPKKMDDLEVFRGAFVSSGIDIDRLIARSQQDEVKKRLIDLTTDAVNRGAFGSPTFFVGNEMFFGKDQLRDVEESIVEQTSRAMPKTARDHEPQAANSGWKKGGSKAQQSMMVVLLRNEAKGGCHAWPTQQCSRPRFDRRGIGPVRDHVSSRPGRRRA